eukprot:7380492-Prymnesium_polylepis.1
MLCADGMREAQKEHMPVFMGRVCGGGVRCVRLLQPSEGGNRQPPPFHTVQAVKARCRDVVGVGRLAQRRYPRARRERRQRAR